MVSDAEERSGAENQADVTLHVERWGTGPPVAFMHGLGGSTRTWDRVRAEMGSSVQGMAADLLGFGRSPKPSIAVYDVDCHLRHLAPAVPTDAIIVGHSAGAILALAYAVRFPERVRGVVLVSLPAFPDRETARHEIARLGMLARLTVDDTRRAKAMCWIMCHLRIPLLAVAPLFARGVPPPVARDALRHTYLSYSQTLRHVIVEHQWHPDLVTLVAERIPVTLVHGRDDNVVLVQHVEVAAPTPASLRIVDGDHYLAISNPKACAEAISALLH